MVVVIFFKFVKSIYICVYFCVGVVIDIFCIKYIVKDILLSNIVIIIYVYL